MGSIIILSSQSLRPVKNGGEVARDHASPTDATKTVIGRPVTLKGSGVETLRPSDAQLAAVLAAPDAAARTAALAAITRRKPSGTGRILVRRDVLAAWRADMLAANGGDATAARAAAQSQLDGGCVILPAAAEAAEAESGDVLDELFADADADAATVPAAPAGKSK